MENARECNCRSSGGSQVLLKALHEYDIQKEKQRQACTDPQCGFCGCIALSSLKINSFALSSMSFRHIVAATVAVATTGLAVSTLRKSLQPLPIG